MPNSEKGLRILSLERTGDESLTLIPLFERIKNRVHLKSVSSLSELKHQLQADSWNVVISNFQYDFFTAFDALDVVKSFCHELPFVLVTDPIGEEVVADMMKAGVLDIVLKTRIERIIPVVKRILRESESREKEAHAHKLASEALAAKEQMLAIVSHDIKNPLGAIQLEAQMLLKAVERSGKSLLAEEVKIQANRILKTTDRMKILISDLLDKNKNDNSLASIRKEEIDIYKVVQEVLDSTRPLSQEKDILVKSMLSENIRIHADKNKMFQVFSNLISNAIKFTPPGGSIQISMVAEEQELIFHVDDSGPGITDLELNKIFEKYWTGSRTECTGTGLGLFICKTIIEAHNGHISVENLSGTGARFKFSIPLECSKNENFSKISHPKDRRKKVYVIDDDDDLREVIVWALGKEGYSVLSFQSAEKALTTLKRERYLPDLIVVDFHMNEMNGKEFLVKKNMIMDAKDCPVMMISASPKDVENEISPEFYKDIITKPIDLEGLVNNVSKHCN